jgi:hypothetical protein
MTPAEYHQLELEEQMWLEETILVCAYCGKPVTDDEECCGWGTERKLIQ